MWIKYIGMSHLFFFRVPGRALTIRGCRNVCLFSVLWTLNSELLCCSLSVRSVQGTNTVVSRKKMQGTVSKGLANCVCTSNGDGERNIGGMFFEDEVGGGRIFKGETVEELRREGESKRGGLKHINGHVGFLWADLGRWCLDKASDFLARNAQSPKETCQPQKRGERKKKWQNRQREGDKKEYNSREAQEREK